jgi:threonine dehydratase
MLGLKTKVIGVVAEAANAIALSFAAGRPVATNTAQTFADGVAVRIVNGDALRIIKQGAERIVTVSDHEIAEAMRLYYRCCHTLSEGAGAAPLAALMQEKVRMAGKRVGLVLTGGNIDMPVYGAVLRGETPAA